MRFLDLSQQGSNNICGEAKLVRQEFCDCFMSASVEIPRQYQMI